MTKYVSDEFIKTKWKARGAGLRFFQWECDTHGFTNFSTNSGECIHCNFEEKQEARNKAPANSRKDARNAGRRCYLDRCGLCGNETKHYTSNARCSECFTTGGNPRSVAGKAANPVRVRARNGNLPTYPGKCPLHGDVPFHTIRGLCSCCYNSLGAPRPLSTNPMGFYVAKDGSFQPCE